MAAYNRGNFRGGYGGGGNRRGGGNRGGGSGGGGNGGGGAGGGNGGDGDGHDGRNLPDIKLRFDRFCCWCGEVITDFALERLLRCPNNRCLCGVPVVGRRRHDGLQRCFRCYSVSHRAFIYCKLCGRRRTPGDHYEHQLNMKGVDPNLIDAQQQAVAAGPAPVAAPVPVAIAVPAAAAVPAPVVAQGPAGQLPPRPPTPHEGWGNFEDDIAMGEFNQE